MDENKPSNIARLNLEEIIHQIGQYRLADEWSDIVIRLKNEVSRLRADQEYVGIESCAKCHCSLVCTIRIEIKKIIDDGENLENCLYSRVEHTLAENCNSFILFQPTQPKSDGRP